MASNEHNPIAERISRIQEIWQHRMSDKSGYRLVRLVIREADLPVVNGFLKLESSPYGKIAETPVVMLTNFSDPTTFAWHLCDDWLREYAHALEQYPQLPWKEHSLFLDKVKSADHADQDSLLYAILDSFSKSLPDTANNILLLGLVPRLLCGYKPFEKWLHAFCLSLPTNIALMVIDYSDNEVYGKLSSELKEQCVTIRLDSLDMEGAYNELLTKGDPEDPDVRIRQIMVEMGKAASMNNKARIGSLGECLIDTGRTSGKMSLWVYTYIVYAGFLFRYKDGKSLSLLDKGIDLCTSHQSDSAVSSMTATLYSYKASYLNYIGRYEAALEWFGKALDYTLLQSDISGAIGICRNIIAVSIRNSGPEGASVIIRKAFPHLYGLEDESLKHTDFFLTAAFLFLYDNEYMGHERHEIEERMVRLYGDDWLSHASLQFHQLKNPKLSNIDAFS